MFQAKRRLLTGLALLALAAGALPVEAQVTKIRVSTIPIIDTAPMQAAIAKGFFAEQGLEVDTTPTAGGAVGLPALAAGQVQITFSNIISIVLGARQGLGFEVIAAGSGTGAEAPDLAGMVTRTGSSLRNGKDLQGKRIAVNTRNNIIWLYARAWVQNLENKTNVTGMYVTDPSSALFTNLFVGDPRTYGLTLGVHF